MAEREPLKIVNVVGGRPNFPKIAPILEAMAEVPTFAALLVHTGQHYDHEMSRIFFEDLKIPEPDFFLGVGSGSHAQQTARVMVEFETVLEKARADLVVVVGDVNSTPGCAALIAPCPRRSTGSSPTTCRSTSSPPRRMPMRTCSGRGSPPPRSTSPAT